MRIVVFDANGSLEAFDYRGVLLQKQEIQANEKIKLPFTQKNFFKFNGVVFGVCQGVGDLDYRDYPKNLNFNALLTETIENYLLNAKEPKNKTQAITNINQAKESTTTQITENKTASLEAITQAKTSANNEITENKTQAITNITEAKTSALNNITQEKQQATSEITEAKKTDHYHNIDFFEIE